MAHSRDGIVKRRQVGEWLTSGGNTITPIQLRCLSGDEIGELHSSLGSLIRRETPIKVDDRVARPERREGASEMSTGYRKSVAAYIRARTGINVPATSLVPCTFYNAFADLVDRLVDE